MARSKVSDFEKRHQKLQERKARFAENQARFREEALLFEACYRANDFSAVYARLEKIVQRARNAGGKLIYGDCENQYGIKMAFVEFPTGPTRTSTNMLIAQPRLFVGPSEDPGKAVVRYQGIDKSKRAVESPIAGKRLLIKVGKLNEKTLIKLLEPLFAFQSGTMPGYLAGGNWLKKLENNFDKARRARIQKFYEDNRPISPRRKNFTEHDFSGCYQQIQEEIFRLNAVNALLECGTHVLGNNLKIFVIYLKQQDWENEYYAADIRPQLRIFPALKGGQIEVQRLGIFSGIMTADDLKAGRCKTYVLGRFTTRHLAKHIDWLLKYRNQS